MITAAVISGVVIVCRGGAGRATYVQSPFVRTYFLEKEKILRALTNAGILI